jgi:hypothetical protein
VPFNFSLAYNQFYFYLQPSVFAIPVSIGLLTRSNTTLAIAPTSYGPVYQAPYPKGEVL